MGYRSFGSDWSYLAPFDRTALVVGPNDSGKSNVLRVLSDHLAMIDASLRQPGSQQLNALREIDAHMPPAAMGFGVAYPIDAVIEAILSDFPNDFRAAQQEGPLRALLASEPLTDGSGLFWFRVEAPSWNGVFTIPESTLDDLERVDASGRAWSPLQSAVTHQSGGSLRNAVASTIAGLYRQIAPPLKNAVPVPAVRQIGLAENGEASGGAGLIDKLLDLQIPAVGQEFKREQWNHLNAFVQEVMDAPDVRLEIPPAEPQLVIAGPAHRLPLSSHGTGFEEVVILAATATVEHDSIVCIEEPEVHLHPGLQKKLLGYLTDRTSNRYFISTHSAHLLDMPNLTVHRVSIEGGATSITTVQSTSAQFAACWELGYRPSDIVQTNCIVWVEGPSDRILLNHWIQRLDSGLEEGRHFTVMFYGGRLLSHLSTDGAGGKVAIPMLNQRPAIVIDSDRSKSGEKMNATKRRVRDEFEDRGHFVWITAGREIENYIALEDLNTAVARVHPSTKPRKSADRYEKVTVFPVDGLKTLDINKVRIAEALANLSMRMDSLDLDERARQLVKYIRDSQ